jgi:hypothetical protein
VAFLGLERRLLERLLKLVQHIAQLGKRLLTRIDFLTCFLAALKLAFTNPSFLYWGLSLVVCMVCMPPCFLHSLQCLLKWTFLETFVCRSSTGSLGSCLALGGSFLARLRIGLFLCAYVLYCLERHEKQTHVYGSHAFLMEVVLILPRVRTHSENVTCQISLGEWNICRCHTGIVACAVVPAGQLCNVVIELLNALYKLMYTNLLGLFGHFGKAVLLLLSHVVGKHG